VGYSEVRGLGGWCVECGVWDVRWEMGDVRWDYIKQSESYETLMVWNEMLDGKLRDKSEDDGCWKR